MFGRPRKAISRVPRKSNTRHGFLQAGGDLGVMLTRVRPPPALAVPERFARASPGVVLARPRPLAGDRPGGERDSVPLTSLGAGARAGVEIGSCSLGGGTG